MHAQNRLNITISFFIAVLLLLRYTQAGAAIELKRLSNSNDKSTNKNRKRLCFLHPFVQKTQLRGRLIRQKYVTLQALNQSVTNLWTTITRKTRICNAGGRSHNAVSQALFNPRRQLL